MRRHLITILIFLLAGAAVNVAVAWGCAVWPKAMAPADLDQPTDYEEGWWAHHTPKAQSSVPVISSRAAAFGLQYFMLHATSGPVEVHVGDAGEFFRPEAELPSNVRDARAFSLSCEVGLPWNQALRVRAGWPMASLSGERWHFGHPFTTPAFRCAPAGPTDGALFVAAYPVIRVTASGSTERPVPLLPLWPGFALNTAFYAAVLWLLICGPFILRRFVRVRRGLCPACAYPMGEAAVCTECGKPLPSRPRPAT
jgi:hypothetical protein